MCSFNAISSIKGFNCQFNGDFIHRFNKNNPIMIEEFSDLYKNFLDGEKIIKISQKEINIILAHQDLDKRLNSENENKNRRIKI